MEEARPETPTKLNGDEETSNGGPAPPSPGASAGGGGGLRRRWRNGTGNTAQPKSLRWSDTSNGAAGRDAYTAELLRAKTRRNLMRDVSQKKIRVQFAGPTPTLPEMSEGDEKADAANFYTSV